MFGRVVWIQLLLTLLGAGLGFAWDPVSGYSAALGGLVATAVNAYFVRRVFAEQALESASQMVATVYRAEIAKLALAAVLFAVVFATVETLSGPAFFAAFGVVYLSSNLAMLSASPAAAGVATGTET